jgi:hypothetical protein
MTIEIPMAVTVGSTPEGLQTDHGVRCPRPGGRSAAMMTRERTHVTNEASARLLEQQGFTERARIETPAGLRREFGRVW